jgi:Kef-type K+ transport system membrane component KefB
VMCSTTTLVVLIGQFFGSTLPARYFGETWRDSFAIGIYMSCKGIVELVVLSILLQANVLSPVSYAALVIMAIVVTAATKPLIDVAKPDPL